MLSSKVWLVAAIAAAGLASGAASAQGNLKIGVVSMARLVEQSPQFEAARKKIEEEFSPRQRDLAAMEQRLRQQTETFQRDAPVMGEAERVNLERQIRDGQREFERTRNELVEDFNLRQNEELGQIQRDVIARTRAYASEQKFDLLLFGDQSVVFASTAVDVTAAVLAALQASPAPAAAPARGQ
jgi:outer membrane protein